MEAPFLNNCYLSFVIFANVPPPTLPPSQEPFRHCLCICTSSVSVHPLLGKPWIYKSNIQ